MGYVLEEQDFAFVLFNGEACFHLSAHVNSLNDSFPMLTKGSIIMILRLVCDALLRLLGPFSFLKPYIHTNMLHKFSHHFNTCPITKELTPL